MRISVEDLALKRSEKKSCFLITGATGFLGSHLFTALCEKGYHVTLLCRPTKSMTAHARVEAILAWFGKTMGYYPNLSVIEGYIDRPEFGMTRTAFIQLSAQFDELIHCASNTDFAERNRAVVETSNIQAFRKVLAFAVVSRCVFFHYISTAYVAGIARGECFEDLSCNTAFNNVYEETKNSAEHIASTICKKHGIRLSIYRPSIVYGDSQTGRSRKFNALYFPVKTITFLREIVEKDLTERGGVRARGMGVDVLGDGRVRMPIRMPGRANGTINLIPVDYFTAAAIALIEEDLRGGIHHIINGTPNSLQDLIEFTSIFVNIVGLTLVNEDQLASNKKNALEELFESYIAFYLPYMADLRIFTSENTTPILQKKMISCPPLTYDVFERCMRYAVDTEWGKKL